MRAGYSPPMPTVDSSSNGVRSQAPETVAGDSGRWWPLFSLVAIAIVFSVWAAIFIFRTSFDVHGQRYFCLWDDAMISMTYARNLVEGYGLNWARWGDPVEGFTCPLWTFVMVWVNLLPIDLPSRSLVVQALALALLLCNLFAVAVLTSSHFLARESRIWLPAVVLTALYYPLNHWSLLGMETSLQTLLITLSVYLALSIRYHGKPRQLQLCLVLTAALLLRPDMLILVAVCLPAAMTRADLTQRSLRERWLPGLLVLVLLPLGYEVFRLAYFGDPLPNTYYLKLYEVPVVVRLLRGGSVFVDFIRPFGGLALAVLSGAVGLAVRRPQYRLPLATILAFFLYSVYVGGDAWEGEPLFANRFVSPVMPLFFVLFTGVLNQLVALVAGRFSRARLQLGAGLLAFALTAIAFLQTNEVWRQPWESQTWGRLALRKRPLYPSHQTSVRDTLRMRSLADKDAILASVWAGIPAYFSDFRMVDILGYSDRHIARQKPAVDLCLDNLDIFRPGHIKWDLDYSLGQLSPDLVYRWYPTKRSFLRAIRRHGFTRAGPRFWKRSDSEKVR